MFGTKSPYGIRSWTGRQAPSRRIAHVSFCLPASQCAGVSGGARLSSAVEAPSGPRPNVPRRVARRHSTRPGVFARLPTAKAFAVRSHKASTQHDGPTAAGIVYEILRDKWS